MKMEGRKEEGMGVEGDGEEKEENFRIDMVLSRIVKPVD